MNWLESKLARMKINSGGYNERRRQEMIRKAWEFEMMAAVHSRDRHPGQYDYYSRMETEYRLRAAWYIKRMKR